MSIHFEDVYARILDISCCQTQFELASVLGISQGFVSDAKRRGTMPAEWLITLHERFGVNSDWILTGRGAQFLESTEKQPDCDSPAMTKQKQLECDNTVLARIKYLCTQTDGTRGIWKRIDENRELLECIQKHAPELLERCPWIYGWISYQDAFLMSLKGLLGLQEDPYFTSIPFLRHWDDKYDSVGMTNYLIDKCITNSGSLAGEQNNGKQ